MVFFSKRSNDRCCVSEPGITLRIDRYPNIRRMLGMKKNNSEKLGKRHVHSQKLSCCNNKAIFVKKGKEGRNRKPCFDDFSLFYSTEYRGPTLILYALQDF